jgi:hypothetical protein
MQYGLCKLAPYVLINLILIPVFAIFPGKNANMIPFYTSGNESIGCLNNSHS